MGHCCACYHIAVPGCVMLTVLVVVQLLASATITVLALHSSELITGCGWPLSINKCMGRAS